MGIGLLEQANEEATAMATNDSFIMAVIHTLFLGKKSESPVARVGMDRHRSERVENGTQKALVEKQALSTV